jgi:S1-C subfamily serine protease
MNMPNYIATAFLVSSISALPAWAQEDAASAQVERMKAEQQQLLEQADAISREAQRATAEARRASAEESSRHAEELLRMREELGRVHRQLRDLSRQVAQAHRELERAAGQDRNMRLINLGDRAVLGVVLGKDNERGVSIIGVSPDGPAERAGLQQGDLLVSIAGVSLEGKNGGGRNALLDVMQGVGPGEALPVEILRGTETLQFTVTAEQREPASWQTVIRLPEPLTDPAEPTEPATAPKVIAENLEVPEIDEAELASLIERINKQVEKFEYMLNDKEAANIDFEHEFELDTEPFSQIGQHAMQAANLSFGLPQGRGLELATLNPQLGKYFKAERGVLVIQAKQDNAYGLEPGDVIQAVGTTEVNSPADLLRVLRDAEPGTDIELTVRRHRRDQKLQAKVPETLLGQMLHYRPVKPEAPPAPPRAD